MTMHCNDMDNGYAASLCHPHFPSSLFLFFEGGFCSDGRLLRMMAGGEKSYMKYESESGFSFLIIVEICGFGDFQYLIRGLWT